MISISFSFTNYIINEIFVKKILHRLVSSVWTYFFAQQFTIYEGNKHDGRSVLTPILTPMFAKK